MEIFRKHLYLTIAFWVVFYQNLYMLVFILLNVASLQMQECSDSGQEVNSELTYHFASKIRTLQNKVRFKESLQTTSKLKLLQEILQFSWNKTASRTVWKLHVRPRLSKVPIMILTYGWKRHAITLPLRKAGQIFSGSQAPSFSRKNSYKTKGSQNHQKLELKWIFLFILLFFLKKGFIFDL